MNGTEVIQPHLLLIDSGIGVLHQAGHREPRAGHDHVDRTVRGLCTTHSALHRVKITDIGSLGDNLVLRVGLQFARGAAQSTGVFANNRHFCSS